MDQQHQHPLHKSPARGESSTDDPTWLEELHQTIGNSGLLSLVTGEERDEETAAALLGQSGLAQPEGARATTDTWSTAMEASSTPALAEETEAPAHEPTGKLKEVFDRHQQRQSDGMSLQLDSGLQWGLNQFKKLWAQHQNRYEAVAQETDVPALLIAAIHYRESSGDFGKYLHQGDPLGRPAVRVPRNIPLFHEWHPAAVHAINMKRGIKENVGIDINTRDPAALATFAEAYNGLGYHNRGRVSPYVYSGTDEYTGGKYVSDGVFSASAKDKQLGIMAMMGSEGGLDSGNLQPQTADSAWARVLSGSQVLRQGSDGLAVEQLQTLLRAAGQTVSVDGDFGPGTRRAVIAFQQDENLDPDGVVGKGTAGALQRNRGNS